MNSNLFSQHGITFGTRSKQMCAATHISEVMFTGVVKEGAFASLTPALSMLGKHSKPSMIVCMGKLGMRRSWCTVHSYTSWRLGRRMFSFRKTMIFIG